MGATATAFKVQSGIVRGVQGARAIATASQGAAEGVEMTSLLSAEGAGVAAEGADTAVAAARPRRRVREHPLIARRPTTTDC